MQVRRSPTAEPRRGAPPDLGLLSESSRTSPEVRRTSGEVRRTSRKYLHKIVSFLTYFLEVHRIVSFLTFFLDLFSGGLNNW